MLQTELSTVPQPPKLRLSSLPTPCPKALWHRIHTPELKDPFPAWASIKYLFGHMVEDLALSLAVDSGHRVEGMQDELVVDGVTGHRDAVIDGCIVDVKSLNGYGMAKLKNKTMAQDDPFGMLWQLDAYLEGSIDDPLVTVKDRAYILGVDKTMGHMCLYEHRKREGVREMIAKQKAIVELSSPPACTCKTEEASYGNTKLGLVASYSDFKYTCFPHLRTFIYKKKDGEGGPTYLTQVVRAPDVLEVDKYGNVLFDPKENQYGGPKPATRSSQAVAYA